MATPNLADVMMRNHVVLQRLSASQVTKIDAFLQQIASELKRRLSGQDLTELAQSRLERMLERFNEYLKQTLGSYQTGLMSDLQAIALNESQSTNKALSISVKQDFTAPAPATIRSAVLTTPLSVSGPDGGKLLKSFLDDFSALTRKRINNSIRLGVAQGQTNAQIATVIRGTAAAKYENGIIALAKRDADKIVHTAVQAVASAARQAVFDANDDIVEGVQWVSTLDSRTCPRCGALDGVVFDSDSGPRPPLHIFCRCATVAKLKDVFAKLQKGGTRPAIGADGVEQVSAKTGYYGWLKTQPASFQDFALGPTRAKLLRDGGLSLGRFAQLQLDKRFMPLTLEEAQKLEPLAFEEAGVDA